MPTIKFIKENPDVIKKDLKKRNDLEKLKWIDLILKKHEQYLDLLKKEQELRHKRNVISEEINQLQKQGKDIKEKIKLVCLNDSKYDIKTMVEKGISRASNFSWEKMTEETLKIYESSIGL